MATGAAVGDQVADGRRRPRRAAARRCWACRRPATRPRAGWRPRTARGSRRPSSRGARGVPVDVGVEPSVRRWCSRAAQGRWQSWFATRSSSSRTTTMRCDQRWTMAGGVGSRDSDEGAMARRLVNITLDNLDDLRAPCGGCVFWELDPVGPRAGRRAGDAAEKEAWVSAVLLEWGSLRQDLHWSTASRCRLRAVRAGGVRAALGRLPDRAGERRRGAADDRAHHRRSSPAAGSAGCWSRRWPRT